MCEFMDSLFLQVYRDQTCGIRNDWWGLVQLHPFSYHQDVKQSKNCRQGVAARKVHEPILNYAVVHWRLSEKHRDDSLISKPEEKSKRFETK